MDYFSSKEFKQHQKKITDILDRIPSAPNPKGWKRKCEFAVGGLEYFGFAESSDILFVSSSSGRSLIDMEKNQKIARDYTADYFLDERLLISKGFDVLEGKTIRLTSKYGGSNLPIMNELRETITKVSPLYPCEDIIFQPPFEHCLSEHNSQNCTRIYRGYVYGYGFSFSGKYIVIAHLGGLTYWEKE